MSIASPAFRLFVGVDIAAATCVDACKRGGDKPTRAITINQTASGFAEFQRQLTAVLRVPNQGWQAEKGGGVCSGAQAVADRVGGGNQRRTFDPAYAERSKVIIARVNQRGGCYPTPRQVKTARPLVVPKNLYAASRALGLVLTGRQPWQSPARSAAGA